MTAHSNEAPALLVIALTAAIIVVCSGVATKLLTMVM